ncbi:complement C3-like [Pangshura tecta]
MGTWVLSLLGALLLLAPRLGQATPMFFLAAPNILRVGNEENVVLQAQAQDGSLSQDVRVHVRLFDFPKKATMLQEKVVWLSPANSSLAMATVQVPEHYVSKGTEQQYVVVQAMFGDVLLEKYILISPHTGYTFVQTDKPIYTPDQKVNYRVFAVNHRMDPLQANGIIVIQSPEGVTVSSTTRKLDKGLYSGTFRIPEHVSLGTWRIVTWFETSPQQPQSAEFEVKEYELPSFDVLLTPTKKFFYLSDTSLTVTIEARFVFNEPVDGYALAIFGVKTDTQKITLQNSLQRTEINDGKGHVTLTGKVLRDNFAEPEELLDAFIFVNVTVFSSGGDMMQADNSEVRIVSSPYSIRFVRTPGFFKPGMPFNFRVYVSNPDGSPASAVPVCSGDQTRTTKEGRATMVLNTQPGKKSLEVQVETCGPLEPPAQQAKATKTILAYETPKSSGHLLHIGWRRRRLKWGPRPSPGSPPSQLLSKGRIVRACTQPHSPGAIVTAWTLDVGPELLPSFRIVAFYYLPDSAELVADAVWVDVADSCMGTLRVGPQNKDDERKVFKPQRELKLEGMVQLPLPRLGLALVADGRLGPLGPWVGISGFPAAPMASCVMAPLDQKLPQGLVQSPQPGASCWRQVQCSVNEPDSNSPPSHSLARHLINKYLPDSITTWHILAVSLRKDKGLCVSEPYEVLVKVPFFVDLRLPHSVVRNEQLELRAVVHNYHEDEEELQVLVELPYQEQLCSPARQEKSFRQRLRVPRGSSGPCASVVVPLELGSVMVELRALAQGLGFRDIVRRMLNVQVGGEIRRLSQSIILNPKGQLQQELVRGHHLENLVPDTDAEVFISVQGDLLGETLVGGLRSSTLQKLITLPYGCVEQNIFSVTPNIILTHYLDTTKQWDQIGVELRDQAVENIAHGYARQRGYRERDGSYKPYQGSTGSTWLTAYILKVFAMALRLGTAISPSELCASARWLIGQRQEPSGRFREDAAIYTPAMQGGYRSSNADASLTAFVLVALKEAESICGNRVNELPHGLQKAQGYLESRLRNLQNPYSVAISSYALALVNSPLANAVLDNFASHDRTHWPVDQHMDRSLYSIEATAYGLLQKLTLGRFEETHPIVRWLVESREFGGGYESTQTTVIGMQALAQYRAATPTEKVVDLKVRVSTPTRKLPELWHIDNSNAYLQRSSSKKYYAHEALNITASGTGTGTVTLLTVYHTLPPAREPECQAFWLAVTVEDVPEDKKKQDDINTFRLRLQARSLGLRDATMTIIDISLLTGFEPNLGDLKQLTNSVEQYIFLFESKGTMSNNSVVLYFTQISNQTDTEVGFRIHQRSQLGMLQPAVVTIYEYYEPARRCSRFYNVPNESEVLRKICQEEVCRCAEDSCPQMTSPDGLSEDQLYNEACDTGVDYVYKVQVEQRKPHNSTVYYSMRVLDVLKSGTDAEASGKVRRFVSHATCEAALGLREQERYLVMGRTRDLWLAKDSYTYVLGKASFIVPWLRPEEAKTDRRKKTFLQTLDNFAHFVGCDT